MGQQLPWQALSLTRCRGAPLLSRRESLPQPGTPTASILRWLPGAVLHHLRQRGVCPELPPGYEELIGLMPEFLGESLSECNPDMLHVFLYLSVPYGSFTPV